MRRLIAISTVLALSGVMGYARDAMADDEYEEEEVVVKKKKPRVVIEDDEATDDNVQVIIVKDKERGKSRRSRRGRVISAEDGEAPPPGYHTETKSLKGVWVAGLSMWASSYFLSVLGGGIADAAEGYDEGKYIYYSLIPVAGPFVIAGHDEIGIGGKMPFILFGAVQAAGLGMFIGGLAAKQKIWVADDVAFEVEPTIGLGTLGLNATF